MDLPDNLLLDRIKESHLYFDKKSLESFTNQINKKYKLARNVVLSQYIFNVLTTNKDATKRAVTLSIHRNDWNNKVAGYLTKEWSYCDITNYDILDASEILFKTKDKSNGFHYVAILCNDKCTRLAKLTKKVQKQPFISEKDRDATAKMLPIAAIIEEKGRQLGLIKD